MLGYYFGYYYDPLLTLLAVIPAALLLFLVYRNDRLEKESGRLLLSLILWGVIATSLALFAENIGTHLLGWIFPQNSVAYLLIENFLIVGLSEECAKYFLLKRKTWNHPEFDCQFDGVVYAVFVSLGFALWENIQYVTSYGFETAVVRALTAVPAHACFGVFMGVWYGAAKRYALAGDEERSTHYRRWAVILPAILHGTYDFLAGLEQTSLHWLFLPFVLVLFALSYLMMKKAKRADHYMGERDNVVFVQDPGDRLK